MVTKNHLNGKPYGVFRRNAHLKKLSKTHFPCLLHLNRKHVCLFLFNRVSLQIDINCFELYLEEKNTVTKGYHNINACL